MKRRAFTLIELLVVVAIIALLIALILPSLAKARDTARRTICLSHMKALGSAFFTYGGNNNGMVPDGGPIRIALDLKTGQAFVPSDTINSSSWPEQLVVDGVVPWKFSMASLTSATSSNYSWACTRGLFYCPSAAHNNPSPPEWPNTAGNQPEGLGGGATGASQVGYGMGYYASSIWYQSANPGNPIPVPASADRTNTNGPYTMKTHYWRPNSIVLLEGDTKFATNNAAAPGAKGRYSVYTSRHNDGANYLLGDGHAEWNNFWNSLDTVKHPYAVYTSVGQTGQPADISIWGHNPYGRRGWMGR